MFGSDRESARACRRRWWMGRRFGGGGACVGVCGGFGGFVVGRERS